MQSIKGASEVEKTLHALNAANRSKGIKVSIVRQGMCCPFKRFGNTPKKLSQNRGGPRPEADKKSDI